MKLGQLPITTMPTSIAIANGSGEPRSAAARVRKRPGRMATETRAKRTSAAGRIRSGMPRAGRPNSGHHSCGSAAFGKRSNREVTSLRPYSLPPGLTYGPWMRLARALGVRAW